jgi:Phage portal protein
MAEKPGFFKRAGQAARYTISGITPATWFSPSNPITPFKPIIEDPRQYDYNVGRNLFYTPGGEKLTGFKELRNLARKSELVRLAIETRLDQIEAIDWKIASRNEDKDDDKDPRIKTITEFFEKPDKIHDWPQWLRMAGEEIFVTDALSIYRRRNKGNTLFSLDLVDGATIFPIIDESGRIPTGNNPAYQQILKGVPKNDYTSEELVYAIRKAQINTPYGWPICYDDKTEILTRDKGWVNFTEVNLSTEVATRSSVGKFEWRKPSHVIVNNHDGEMISFNSRSVDLLVTPDHRMLVTALPRALGGKRGRKGEAVVKAKDIAAHYNHEIKIPMTSAWEGVEVGQVVFDRCVLEVECERIHYGKINRYTRHCEPAPVRAIEGDDYCALMGAYLSEGNIRKQGGIEINQRAFSKGYQAYKKLIDKLGGSYNGKAFILSWAALTEYFRQFGHCHEKFIPEDVLNATPRQLRIFWDHYMLGDGSYRDKPNKSGRGNQPAKHESITTASKRMSGQLVEIAQKLGFSASVAIIPARKKLILGRMNNIRESYVVSARYSKAMGFKATKTKYKGKTYCVTVPNGIIYVRRNGKPAWCGNCEQIINVCKTDIERTKYQLSYFTDGSVPDSYITAPDGMTADKIKIFETNLNALLAGNWAGRHQMPVLLHGMEVKQLKEPPLMTEFDEWFWRKVAFAFSLPPTPMVKMNNRATAQNQKESATEEGLLPFMRHIKRLMDKFIKEDFEAPDLQFVWDDEEERDPLTVMQVETGYVDKGIKSINEARQEMGLAGIKGGELPMLATPNGFVPLNSYDDQMKLQQQAADTAQIAAKNPKPVVAGNNAGVKKKPTSSGTTATTKSHPQWLM